MAVFVCAVTCARRALKDSFSLEMLFSTTSSLTRLSLCWTCSSWVRTSSDSNAESWAWRTTTERCFYFSLMGYFFWYRTILYVYCIVCECVFRNNCISKWHYSWISLLAAPPFLGSIYSAASWLTVLPCVCSCPELVFEVPALSQQCWWCPAGGAPFPQASSPPAAGHRPDKRAQKMMIVNKDWEKKMH